MPLVIEKKQIKEFIKELKKKFTVIDASKNKGPLPLAKKHLYPARDETFKFDFKKGKADSPESSKKTIIFGLDSADLKAAIFLDQVMKKPKPDFFYWQKRKKAVLIGLFDHSIDAPPGGDIVFEKINPRQYQVLALSDKGKKIAKGKIFKRIKKPKIKKYSFKETPLDKILLDSELLAEVVARSYNHKIWTELDKKCLGCGNCTYVCPLCYCFSVEDKISLDEKECRRCRIWDACTLPEFSEIAGGHKFHKSIKMRYYNWFYHKFVRGYKEYGRSLCTACHRCQKYCPAGIDIEEILLKLIKDYKKGK